MPLKKDRLDEFFRFDDDDPVARLIVHYFYPADFLYRENRRLNFALAVQDANAAEVAARTLLLSPLARCAVCSG
jgi:hypothetical protein